MKKADFREIKDELRIVGIDDGSFEAHTEGVTCLVGAVLRGGEIVDGVMVDEVEIDGMDSTPTVIDMVNESRHKDQLRVIMTNGITFAGFNVLNVTRVFEETGLPVIVVSRVDPDMPSIKEALKNLSDWEERWKILNSTGDIIPIEMDLSQGRNSTIYIQAEGIEKEDAKKVVRMSSTRSSIPEPIRLAHLIATGVSRGESVGRV